MRRKFLKNNSGLAYIYAVGLLSFLLMPFVYFPFSYAFDHVYTLIVGDYTFTGTTALGIAAIQFIMSYMLAFGAIFTVAWMIVNAHAQQYD